MYLNPVRCRCKVCKKDCLYPRTTDVRDLIEKINKHIAQLGCQYASYLCFTSPKVDLSSINTLKANRTTLQTILDSLKYSKEDYCICPSGFFKIKDRLLKVIGIKTPDLVRQEVDSSGRDEWVLNNPGKVRYENWERALVRSCPIFEINIKEVKKEEVSLIYNVQVKRPEIKDLLSLIVEKKKPALKAEVKELKNISWLTPEIKKVLKKKEISLSIVEKVEKCEAEFVIKNSQLHLSCKEGDINLEGQILKVISG